MCTRKEIISADGSRRILIYSNARNLYRFDESVRVTENGVTYWGSPTMSGLYESAEAAEQAARLEIAWLQNPDPK
jgi:ribulose-5-phosphate 4-epimerase/fuculose-1-phosphate aldolase